MYCYRMSMRPSRAGISIGQNREVSFVVFQVQITEHFIVVRCSGMVDYLRVRNNTVCSCNIGTHTPIANQKRHWVPYGAAPSWNDLIRTSTMNSR